MASFLQQGLYGLLPSNARAYLESRLADKGLPINKGYDENFLSSGDLDYLREKGREKLKKGTISSGLGYVDWGIPESEVLNMVKNKPEAMLESFTNTPFRMATLLGNSAMKIENGNLYVTDSYNINSTKTRERFKKLINNGEYLKADKLIAKFDTLEQETIRAYAEQKLDAKSDKVKINLGKIKDLLR